MEYKTICIPGTNEFNKAANELIQQGWKPLGGVSATSVVLPMEGSKTALTVQFAQAFIKE